VESFPAVLPSWVDHPFPYFFGMSLEAYHLRASIRSLASAMTL
jgi:hypothetical protein